MTSIPAIGWMIEALIASTVLMLLVLTLRRPVRRAFGAEIAYALWALPVLRLVLPPLPAMWREAAVAPVARATEQVTILFVDRVDTLPAVVTAAPVYLMPIVAVLWLGGAVLFLGWHALAHRRFCRRLLEAAGEPDAVDGVRVIETDAATGPLAFGIVRRYVAFPRDFAERFDWQERDLALAHELGHHARGDLLANWAALVVLALHWFNPVAWRAFRAFRADQELANDARVLAGLDPMSRHSYACAILKAAHPTHLGGTVAATCHLHTIDDLKGRLRMLTTRKMSRIRLLGGAGAMAVLIAAGLGLTASGTQAAERVRSGVQRATGVDIVMPTMPTVPVMAPMAVMAGARQEVPASPLIEGALPPAPPAPLVPDPALIASSDHSESVDGKIVRRHVVRIAKDGKIVTNDQRAGMPEITSIDCAPAGDQRQMVINESQGERRKIIICLNRIQKAAAAGAEMAANSKDIERNAYHSGLVGLHRARQQVNADVTLGGEERAQALTSIDQAIAELDRDIARVD